MRYFALRAFVKVGVFTSIAYARIDATYKYYGLEAGEKPNMGSCPGEILHACLGKVICHLIEGQGS